MYLKKIKKFSVLALILFTLALTGCTFNITNNFSPPEEKHFTLKLFNDCKSDIYGYRVEYFLDGNPIGGMVGCNADESKLSGKDALQMLFYEKHFPEDSDLSAFQIEISVLDKEMNESEPADVISWAAEYGKSYDIRIGGSFEDGFSAVRE